MFTELIFLILLLLVTSVAPEVALYSWPSTPGINFFLGIVLYAGIIAGIAIQNRKIRHSRKRLAICQLELLIALTVYHFIMAPHIFFFPSLTSPMTLLSLVLYFTGLAIVYYTSNTSSLSARRYAILKIRFLLPFIIPFVLLEVLSDATAFEEYNVFISVAISATLLAGLMVFFPPILQRMWGCKPFPESPLKKRLEALCLRANFKHAGLKIWDIMKHSMTAAIMGISSRFRYVMFTESIIERFPDEEIEAILAHEIGHSYRKHLIIYPFILLGMIVLSAIFSMFFGEAFDDFFGFNQLLSPSSAWNPIKPFVAFLPFACMFFIYFRFVFGFFSRNFERQADLHVYHLGTPPEALISALDRIGNIGGKTHKQPNWHHHSIYHRIRFLYDTIADPSLIMHHHKHVKRIVSGYFVLLALAVSILTIPSYMDFSIDKTISGVVNGPLRARLARHYIISYQLPGDKEVLEDMLVNIMSEYPGSTISGVTEFYGALKLLNSNDTVASASLMVQAWKHFNFADADIRVRNNFKNVSANIIQQAVDKNVTHNAIEELSHIIQKQEQ